VEKHKYYLNMIRWATIDPTIKLTQATACAINTGVLGEKGEATQRPARIFVDDSLLLAIGCRLMELALAALIEAIFVIMGKPDAAIRQCLLALDKWVAMVPGPTQTMLGLIHDTNELTVGIPGPFICKLHDLINIAWHKNCQSFTVHEAQQLVRNLGHLAKGAPWAFHLLTHLYASIAYALGENKCLLQELSPEFRAIVQSLSTGSFPCSSNKQVQHISFALKKAATLIHHAKYKFAINKSMRQEIEFFRDQL
jgi:hypothetical protein